MKNILTLLLFVAGIGVVSSGMAQPHPRKKVNRAFAHSAGASRSKTNKAHFRAENNDRPIIDFTPHRLEKTRTVKAPKPYKFSKGNDFKAK
jgi:hypothetical protein